MEVTEPSSTMSQTKAKKETSKTGRGGLQDVELNDDV